MLKLRGPDFLTHSIQAAWATRNWLPESHMELTFAKSDVCNEYA
jgi:hypothetical protein